jgi:hypothetical protein
MSLTDSQYKTMILAECALDTDQKAAKLIQSWWGLYSGKSSKHLQYLYTKKHVLLWLLGQVRKKKDVKIDRDESKSSQEVANVRNMISEVREEIKQEDPYASVATLESFTMEGGDEVQDSGSVYVSRIAAGDW